MSHRFTALFTHLIFSTKDRFPHLEKDLGQEKHHQRVSYQDEVRVFLKKHGIAGDERYMWG